MVDLMFYSRESFQVGVFKSCFQARLVSVPFLYQMRSSLTFSASSIAFEGVRNCDRDVTTEPKRPGRPPAFSLEKRTKLAEVHLLVSLDVLEAVRAYCQDICELSTSTAVRRLLYDRLAELGYLKKVI